MKRIISFFSIFVLMLTLLFSNVGCSSNNETKYKEDPYTLTGYNVFDNGYYILADFETYYEVSQPAYANSLGKITMIKDSQYVTRGEGSIRIDIIGSEQWVGANIQPQISFWTENQYFHKVDFSDCDKLCVDIFNPTENDIKMGFLVNKNSWQEPDEIIALIPGWNYVEISLEPYDVSLVSVFSLRFDRGSLHDYKEVIYMDNLRAHKISEDIA